MSGVLPQNSRLIRFCFVDPTINSLSAAFSLHEGTALTWLHLDRHPATLYQRILPLKSGSGSSICARDVTVLHKIWNGTVDNACVSLSGLLGNQTFPAHTPTQKLSEQALKAQDLRLEKSLHALPKYSGLLAAWPTRQKVLHHNNHIKSKVLL